MCAEELEMFADAFSAAVEADAISEDVIERSKLNHGNLNMHEVTPLLLLV